MHDIVSTTVSLEQTHAFPHNQYSGNFLGARHASQRHRPQSRQIMESDWSPTLEEGFAVLEAAVAGRGKGDSNVLIKLKRGLFKFVWWWWCS